MCLKIIYLIFMYKEYLQLNLSLNGSYAMNPTESNNRLIELFVLEILETIWKPIGWGQ